METIPNMDNLPSPTQARAEAVDTKVGKGELWGGRDPGKADQKRGQLLYLGICCWKRKECLDRTPTELFLLFQACLGSFWSSHSTEISHLL